MEFIRKNKKSILEILFLVLLVVFTFYALLKDQELDKINQALKTQARAGSSRRWSWLLFLSAASR